jgi:hypothetical protein
MSKKSCRRWDIRHSDSRSNFWTKVPSSRVFDVASRQHGLARHRHFFPRSSSASRFTVGAFGSSSPLGCDQSLIACGGSKTVSITVQTPSADCPCGGTGRVCVEIYPISADGTRGVAVAIFVCGYALVANRTRRPAVAVAISANVLTADPARRIAVSISVGIYGAMAVNACRITRSVRVKAAALGVQRKTGNREHQRCKNEARHRIARLMLIPCDNAGR